MKRTSRLRSCVYIAAGTLVLYTLVGFFVVPPIARSQSEKRLSAELGRRVTVEKIRFNPFTFSSTVENFSIFEKDNTTPFLGWRRLHLNVDGWFTIWREWTVSGVALDGFHTRVAINADKSLNFSDLLAKLPPPSPGPIKPAGRPVRVESFNVTNAQVDFSDQSLPRPFETKLGPLTFAVAELHTTSQAGAPYRFDAVTESGEKLTWSGTLQANPPGSRGEFSIENFLLAKYSAYHADLKRADFTDGKVNLRAGYEINLAENNHVAKIHEGVIEVRDMKVIDRPGGDTAVEVQVLDVKGIHADGLAQKAGVDAIAVTGGKIRARREKDGAINLVTMMEPGGDPAARAKTARKPENPPKPAARQPAGPTPAVKPDVTIGEFVLKDFQVEFADQATLQPTQLTLGDLQFSVRNVSLAEGAQMPLQLAFTWAPQGTVRMEGNVALTPMKADLTLDVASFELLPVSPYLEEFTNARLTGGMVSAGLSIEAAMPKDKPPAGTVVGGVKAEKFGLVDSKTNEELAGFVALTLQGLRASNTPELTVHLDEVNLAGPFTHVVMNEDKTLNLMTLARTGTTAGTSEPTEAPPAAQGGEPLRNSETPSGTLTRTEAAQGGEPLENPESTALPQIDIGKVVLSDGDFRFSDRSIEPHVNMAVNQVTGTISGLSSDNPAKADLDLKATVDGAGPIAVAGKIDPLGPSKSFDLKVDFKNVDLMPLSPYSGKFAGYELARGKLMLDVKAKVVDNKIDSGVVLTLNQFTFGSATKSPEATKLPVRLGVALLKGADGKIVVDVPVQGSLDDPSFKVGRVVWRVIGNLLTKAATSPFSLLGAAFGGGGDELAWQDFAPGSTELRAEETKKLDTMVKALTNRPGLSLDLQGSYDAAADAQALKKTKLDEAVRKAIWENKRSADPNIPPPAQLAVTAEEEAAIIKKMFDAKFPPGTELGAPTPPPPEMVAPPPAPTALFPKLVAKVTFKKEREEKAAKEENDRRIAEHEKAKAAAIATGLPVDQMRSRLEEATEVNENDLRNLAAARAKTVRDYFLNIGNISPERLFLAKEQAEPSKDLKGARVVLAMQ